LTGVGEAFAGGSAETEGSAAVKEGSGDVAGLNAQPDISIAHISAAGMICRGFKRHIHIRRLAELFRKIEAFVRGSSGSVFLFFEGDIDVDFDIVSIKLHTAYLIRAHFDTNILALKQRRRGNIDGQTEIIE